MNDKIQALQYHPTVEVRMVMQNDEPWWVLSDVCRVLELTTPAKAAERLDEDEKGRSFIHTLGGLQEMTIINESGLYSVILRSNKPEAKAFKRWITHEVLPSIRRTGTYSAKGAGGIGTPLLGLPPCMEPLPVSVNAQHLLHKLQEIDSYNPDNIQIGTNKLAWLLGFKSAHTLIAARKELVKAGYIRPVRKPSKRHLDGSDAAILCQIFLKYMQDSCKNLSASGNIIPAPAGISQVSEQAY